ncbi:bifunctional methylenetetrahydrofolate dehydrogenase/methenyltetrahydrofolate cyclohydrolase FolD [Bacillus pfraonensis]|uniref:Bifunctional protein FolD n=1 Tax=Bacillus bingmayongensis TaxID=1150157 RepID=A0ABU5JVJ9_9BACI|nr:MULTISPECIES: bifunctional methylenetetrahydrofolate dehydrogenase/methenyltetrahydrofolate cyclohydrolase FolD [Bacillus]MBO1583080.1 bifunctional methylenetetrahydrofolate dehydrogenase/methenyltetrahydrofolate cyclohydrolase FolD [Bacillus sp. XF8]MBY0597339.1 bifunctional methylenetetrahydrofolate dehydrogenase/methenyltetrahydrofolate cyclohydrolase FolD [Bacillus bingmayongensis]MDZ5607459.1 bifunctional methylenetetrahydrofolate dehydrogenase/methenyltetrahydrofolate cyclohydrolase Fol
MVAVIIKGNEVAEKKRAQLKEEVVKLKEQGIVPGLAVILVGEDPASRSYVKGKEKGCEQVGIYSELIEFPDTITEERLLAEIDRLNEDDRINGILVQLPLPKHIEEKAIIERISPEKDVDGFHPISVGRMMTGQDTFLPCTPHGIVELVKETNLDISGKHVVVIGRSNIVGKPVGQLFLNENATVTYCHSKTKNIKELSKLADILIVAVGRPKMVTADYIKEGAVVIDVGVNRLETGKLCGDVDFDNVLDIAGYITPVPKGVGPMTITMLLHNTVESAKRAGVACK